MLRGEGKFIIKLVPAKDDAPATPTASDKKISASGRGVKRQEVITFVQQFSVMLDTGVPISEALECCVQQAQTPAFAAVLEEVKTSVQGGNQLSVALARHPRAFPAVMVSMIKASELSGTMAPMLDRIATYLSKELATVRQVKSAMTYPMFMMTMALSVTIFLLAVVLPKFAKIYEGRGATLPMPTRMLMAISNGLIEYWYLWILVCAGIATGLYFLVSTRKGRYVIDWLKLHTPLLREMYTHLYLCRATRTMGTMLASGVSMLDVIASVKDVTQNMLYEELWDTVDSRLRQGAQLSDTLVASKLIPRSISQMVRSGEKSGRLSQVCLRVAEFTEVEFDRSVKTCTQFIEPLMVGVMGGMIGFVSIALLLPIFSVGKVMAGN